MISAAAYLACVATIYLIVPLGGAHTGDATITWHLLLTGWMLFYWWRSAQGRISSGHVIAVGLVARILLIPIAPFTTHDVERYLWDGAVVLAGFDPYAIAPNASDISWLRAYWPTPEEHAEYPTLYPPLALGAFALCALAGPSAGLWVWKSLVALVSIATLLVMAHCLRRVRREQHLPLVALSPLMLLEAGVGAHVDALAALAIAGAIAAVLAQRWVWVGAALGAGAAIKLIPIVLLAPLCAALTWTQRGRLLAGAALVLATIYGVALQCAWKPVGSLPVFFEKWRFGSPLYDLLARLEWLAYLPALALLLLGIGCWYARRDLLRGATLVLSTPLLLSPVVFPWYLLVLLPLCAMRPNTLILLWLTLAPLTYEVLNAFNDLGLWQPADWPKWTIAAGWIGGLVALHQGWPGDGVRGSRYRAQGAAPDMPSFG